MTEEDKFEVPHFPVVVDKITSMKDGSFKVVLRSQEIDERAMVDLFSLRGTQGWAIVKPNRVQEKELAKLPEDADLKDFGKSASQRLRNTLFVLYDKKGRQGSFQSFYERNMEKFIERVKEEIQNYE